MKKFLVLIIFVFMLSGCNEQPVKETKDMSTWSLIMDKEWINSDNWAGSGLYFYAEDDNKYCTFKIYGSGVPTIYDYTSEVAIEEEGIISIELPEKVQTGYLDKEKENSDKIVKIKLKHSDGVIKLGDMEFKPLMNE